MTSRYPPPSNVAILGFCLEKVAQCTETYEKTIFRFLVFKKRLKILKIFTRKMSRIFFFQNMRNVLKRMQNRFLVFDIWSILYSKFVVNWELGDFCEPDSETINQWYPITSWLGGLNLKVSAGDTFGCIVIYFTLTCIVPCQRPCPS